MKKYLVNKLKNVSGTKIDQYIYFCKENNLHKRIKGESAHHHILPVSLFPEFENLSINGWNGVYLTFENHYKAHALLADLTDNISVISAWWGMNNQKYRQDHILSNEQIIGSELHHKLMKKRTKLHIQNMEKEVIFEGVTMKNIKKINILSGREKVKEYYDEEQGIYTSIAKEQGKKCSIRRQKQGKHFNLYKGDNIIKENLTRVEVNKIAQSLLKSSKLKPLGSSVQSRTNLLSHKKEELIGCYIEEIK